MTLPDRLVEALRNSAFLQRHPAYVALCADGCIREAGGAWHRYWHGEPALGASITLELPFLVGLVPIGTQSDLLPRVDLGFGASADIYLLPDPDVDWILLVDAGNLDLARHFQQARHTTHLLQHDPCTPPQPRRRLTTRRSPKRTQPR